MKQQEWDALDEALKVSSTDKKSDFDYEGYTILDNLTLSRVEIEQAIDIMWEIVMTLKKEDRDSLYLFGNGLLPSKDLFLKKKEESGSLKGAEKEQFEQKVDIFRKKLENIKPLVQFLMKVKEVM